MWRHDRIESDCFALIYDHTGWPVNRQRIKTNDPIKSGRIVRVQSWFPIESDPSLKKKNIGSNPANTVKNSPQLITDVGVMNVSRLMRAIIFLFDKKKPIRFKPFSLTLYFQIMEVGRKNPHGLVPVARISVATSVIWKWKPVNE